MKEVRKSIESNIKQIGTNLSADAIGRIKGDIDNGWLDESVIDCAQNLNSKRIYSANEILRLFLPYILSEKIQSSI